MFLTDGASLRSLLYSAGAAAAAYGVFHYYYYYIPTVPTEDPVQRVSKTISSVERALQDQDIEACSAHERYLISQFRSLQSSHEIILEDQARHESDLFTVQSLEREMSRLNSMFVSLQEREHQLKTQITQYHMMDDNEMRGKMQNEQEALNRQAKVRLEPMAKLYQKENEMYKTLKENYEKVMESNIQQELERTELQNQLYAMRGLVQQLKEQNCDADKWGVKKVLYQQNKPDPSPLHQGIR